MALFKRKPVIVAPPTAADFVDLGYYADDVNAHHYGHLDDYDGRVRIWQPGRRESYQPDLWDRAEFLTRVECGPVDIVGFHRPGNVYANRIAIVRINTDDAKLAAALEAVVSPHLTATSPVRRLVDIKLATSPEPFGSDPASTAILVPLQVEYPNCFGTTDPRNQPPGLRISRHSFTIHSGNEFFNPHGSAYRWAGGADLRDTPRAALATMTQEIAAEIVAAATEIISTFEEQQK